jgi:hypothetical protein
MNEPYALEIVEAALEELERIRKTMKPAGRLSIAFLQSVQELSTRLQVDPQSVATTRA